MNLLWPNLDLGVIKKVKPCCGNYIYFFIWIISKKGEGRVDLGEAHNLVPKQLYHKRAFNKFSG